MTGLLVYMAAHLHILFAGFAVFAQDAGIKICFAGSYSVNEQDTELQGCCLYSIKDRGNELTGFCSYSINNRDEKFKGLLNVFN